MAQTFFYHTSLSSVSLIYWGFIFDLFPGPFLSYYVINMKINNYTIIYIVMYIYMRSLSKSFVICFLFKHLSNNSTLVTDSIDHIISIIINYITSLEFFNEMFRNNPYRPTSSMIYDLISHRRLAKKYYRQYFDFYLLEYKWSTAMMISNQTSFRLNLSDRLSSFYVMFWQTFWCFFEEKCKKCNLARKK